MKITKHKNSKTGLEQVLVSEGRDCIRFNIWIEKDKWVGKSVGLIDGEAEEVELLPCDTREELIRILELVAEKYFEKLFEIFRRNKNGTHTN
jgi:hypothetical protein